MTRFPQIPSEAVVYDLEFTAWEGSMAHRWLRPGEFTEVVQIGAVKIDSETLDEIDAFHALVRPRINPCLSAYFEKLTGVTNERLAEEGVDFLDAYRRFAGFAAGTHLYSFGRDDRIFDATLRLYGIVEAPFLPATTNIAPWLVEHGIDVRGFHACDVARLAGVAFHGRPHDGLDDARSVAAGMRAVVGRGSTLFPRDAISAKLPP